MTEGAAPLPELVIRPRHVAIIMDGNGRWAEARNLSRSEGHRAGADAARGVIERLAQHGVEVSTLFAFSTENWGRPRAEVEAILRLAGHVIERDLDELHEAGIRLRHVGELDELPRDLQQQVRLAVDRTAANSRMTVNLAFNYGGRADIVRAVQQLVTAGSPADAITEAAIAARLATGDQPEPDLLIRTGGEQRISNFLVWQAAYAEYYFTPVLWPDFGPAQVDEALIEFANRQRRFGRLGEGDIAPLATRGTART